MEAGHLQPLCDAAAKHALAVMVGCYERPKDRGGHTGYCSLAAITPQGELHHVHRKLMPTYEERLAWGIGDGNGLQTLDLAPFTIGGLNCWENWMPLARAALYAQGVNLHVAIWPGGPHNTRDITRFIAIESRSFVLSVSGVLRRSDIPESFPHYEEVVAACPEVLAAGGSAAAAPNGDWLLEPIGGDERLEVVALDYRHVLEERHNFDPSGHYARPDVFQLAVDRHRQQLASFEDDG